MRVWCRVRNLLALRKLSPIRYNLAGLGFFLHYNSSIFHTIFIGSLNLSSGAYYFDGPVQPIVLYLCYDVILPNSAYNLPHQLSFLKLSLVVIAIVFFNFSLPMSQIILPFSHIFATITVVILPFSVSFV